MRGGKVVNSNSESGNLSAEGRQKKGILDAVF